MPKIARSYRLEEDAVKQLEELVAYYNEYQKNFADNMPSLKKRASQSDVLEFIINQHHTELAKDHPGAL